VVHSLSRERWSCFSGSACNVFWCPKMPSRRVFESVASCSSLRCSACRQYWSSLLLLGLFSSYFPLLPWKLQLDPFCYWYINFSPFLFHHFILIFYFFFQFGPRPFDYFFRPFVELIFFSISPFNKKFVFIFLFQFWFCFFDCFLVFLFN
jgi:hypothetical protein